MKENLKQLIEAFKSIDENIVTEDFTNKIETIFEAAIEARISVLREDIEKEVESKQIFELQEFKDTLINNLDKYLDESVKDFMENFKPEIEDTIKSTTFQKLFDGIMEQFQRYNINVPVSQMDIVESLKEENEKIEEKVNELINEKFNLQEKVLKEQCMRIFSEKTNDMAMTEIEKLKIMMKDVSFEDAETFSEKMDVMIGNFLVEDKKELNHDKLLNENNFQSFTKVTNKEDEKTIDNEIVASYMKTFGIK